jgi:hypothetical protein
MTSFQYVLWPGYDLCAKFDSFTVGSYRLSLQGSALTVDIDEAGDEDANSAWKMASRYVDALRRSGVPMARLMTFAEFGAMPPRFLISHTSDHGQRGRLSRCLRVARTEVLGCANARLARCYNYLQEAREDPEHALFHLYKLLETIEAEFGGERQAVRVLSYGIELKFIKSLANRPTADQRHAPGGLDVTSKPSEDDRELALQHARTILKGFEDYWREARRGCEPAI